MHPRAPRRRPQPRGRIVVSGSYRTLARSMNQDRRGELRRLDDVRELMVFCNQHRIAIPARAVDRLAALGLPDPQERPTAELLQLVDALRRPSREGVPTERRRWPRRYFDLDPKLGIETDEDR